MSAKVCDKSVIIQRQVAENTVDSATISDKFKTVGEKFITVRDATVTIGNNQ